MLRGGRLGAEKSVSIGAVKREISELVNRVAYGHERVVLTSRGKPKAALVSLQDLERLQREESAERIEHWQQWLRKTDSLLTEMSARRGGAPIDVDELLRQDREDLEGRDGWIAGRH
jgi:prevent-host-death family protein